MYLTIITRSGGLVVNEITIGFIGLDLIKPDRILSPRILKEWFRN